MSDELQSFQSVPYAKLTPPPLNPRPTSVTVVAILAIISGSAGILMTLCSVPQLLLGGHFAGSGLNYNTSTTTTTINGTTTTTVNSSPGPNIFALQKDPTVVVSSLVSSLCWFIIAVIALWAGIGLLHLKPQARLWIKRYAVADIVLIVAGLVVQIAFIQPKTIAFMQTTMSQNSNPNASVNIAPLMKVGVYVGDALSLLWIAWPITVLYIMNKPNVKAAFGFQEAIL